MPKNPNPNPPKKMTSSERLLKLVQEIESRQLKLLEDGYEYKYNGRVVSEDRDKK